jgi:hypothetical protein
MADTPVPQNWLVSTSHDVEEKWKEVQIQERISRINRHRQDIEDLQKGKIKELEIKITMLEKEVEFLKTKQVVDVAT